LSAAAAAAAAAAAEEEWGAQQAVTCINFHLTRRAYPGDDLQALLSVSTRPSWHKMPPWMQLNKQIKS